jgi:ATP-dependent Clp protease ATP-binding subunit ClpB
VDFRNVILIMTSNVGSAFLLEAGEDAERRALEALRGTFRPEFLNRLDGVVVFKRLDRALIRQIVDIQLRQLGPLLAQRELELELTDAAKSFLAERGYDPDYGARPLRRAIQEYVLEPLSEKLIAGEITAGQRVIVDRADGGLAFRTAPRRAAA